MLRLLADENLTGAVIRGLLLREPDLDAVRAQDAGLSGADDAAVVAWAAEEGRIVLTHDRATMPECAWQRIAAGDQMPGPLILHNRFPVGEAIAELVLIATCSEASDWQVRVVYLPL